MDDFACPTCGYDPAWGCDCDGYYSREMERVLAFRENREPRICPVCRFPAGDARCHCWEDDA